MIIYFFIFFVDFLIGEFFADDGTGHARRTGLETSAVTVAVTCLA